MPWSTSGIDVSDCSRSLLSQCALASRHGLSLIKNDRDASDNVYGAQENYEATLAEGWRLAAWRCGLVLLFPLAMLTWFSILACVLVTLAYFLFAGLFYFPVRLFAGRNDRLTLLLFGRDISEGRESCVHLPVWLETVLQATTRVVTAPLAISLFVMLRTLAFNKIHQRLLPFLISRSIFAGSGMVDHDGQFQISDKGPCDQLRVWLRWNNRRPTCFYLGSFFQGSLCRVLVLAAGIRRALRTAAAVTNCDWRLEHEPHGAVSARGDDAASTRCDRCGILSGIFRDSHRPFRHYERFARIRICKSRSRSGTNSRFLHCRFNGFITRLAEHLSARRPRYLKKHSTYSNCGNERSMNWNNMSLEQH